MASEAYIIGISDPEIHCHEIYFEILEVGPGEVSPVEGSALNVELDLEREAYRILADWLRSARPHVKLSQPEPIEAPPGALLAQHYRLVVADTYEELHQEEDQR